MMDIYSTQKRSEVMRRIRSQDSGIEIRLRRALWSKGLRYRKNYARLPGKPDVVFLHARIAVFCDSEFWHGYDWEHRKADFKSHTEFWIPKIERNVRRDEQVSELLEKMGWRVMRFWGHEITGGLSTCVEKIVTELDSRKQRASGESS